MATRIDKPAEETVARPVSAERKRAKRSFGQLIVATAALLPLGLWLSAGSLNRFLTPFASLRQLAILAAYTAATMMALNIALCARHPAVVRLFGGMGHLFRTHMMVGKLAFALVIVHVTLMVASIAVFSPLAGLSLLTPAAGWAVFAGVLAFALLTVSVVGRLAGGSAGSLHRLVGLSFLLASTHYLSVAGLKSLSPAVAPYLAIVMAVGVTAYAYRMLSASSRSPATRKVKATREVVEEAAEIVRGAEVESKTK